MWYVARYSLGRTYTYIIVILTLFLENGKRVCYWSNERTITFFCYFIISLFNLFFFWIEHKQRVSILEEALEREREKAEKAQRMIEDIERECREPFVVPALLQAYMDLSTLVE